MGTDIGQSMLEILSINLVVFWLTSIPRPRVCLWETCAITGAYRPPYTTVVDHREMLSGLTSFTDGGVSIVHWWQQATHLYSTDTTVGDISCEAREAAPHFTFPTRLGRTNTGSPHTWESSSTLEHH